eukprot:351810-Chlamydomonas_euryale.AAC.3
MQLREATAAVCAGEFACCAWTDLNVFVLSLSRVSVGWTSPHHSAAAAAGFARGTRINASRPTAGSACSHATATRSGLPDSLHRFPAQIPCRVGHVACASLSERYAERLLRATRQRLSVVTTVQQLHETTARAACKQGHKSPLPKYSN